MIPNTDALRRTLIKFLYVKKAGEITDAVPNKKINIIQTTIVLFPGNVFIESLNFIPSNFFDPSDIIDLILDRNDYPL